MGLFHHDSDEAKAYATVEAHSGEPHEASLSHQLIAGAAAYEAAKAYQHHKEKEGEPSDHAKAKRVIAGFAGVIADRLIETKGLDYIDKVKAKKAAEARAEEALKGGV